MYSHSGKHNSWAAKSIAALMAFALFAFNYSDIAKGVRDMPPAYFAESRAELNELLGSFELPSGLTVKTVSAISSGDQSLADADCSVECRLFGFIPLKKVGAYVRERPSLTPCGHAVGVSIYTEGVLVVGLGSFTNSQGRQVSPAAEAGLKAGDIIHSAGGADVSTSAELQSIIDSSPSGVELYIERGGSTFTRTVVPQASGSGDGDGLRIGAWIRDSTVGVGTLSFYDSSTGAIAALGHAVVDADTGTLLKVKDGRLVFAQVIGVSRGQQGAPGELHGTFNAQSEAVGSICGNSELGVFGYVEESAVRQFSQTSLQVAFPDEVHTGEAYLLAAVDNEGVRQYSCRILKTGTQNEPAQKGLVLQITDPELIDKTGGIVQGMSGSPILQDGRLVGVVTHVFVNDPQKGYGAYAYWMYDTLMG